MPLLECAYFRAMHSTVHFITRSYTNQAGTHHSQHVARTRRRANDIRIVCDMTSQRCDNRCLFDRMRPAFDDKAMLFLLSAYDRCRIVIARIVHRYYSKHIMTVHMLPTNKKPSMYPFGFIAEPVDCISTHPYVELYVQMLTLPATVYI